MEVDDKTIGAVEKILKEPVAAQFSDQAWRIRTNLIIASTIGLVMGLADLRIHPDSSILGLRFTGLSDTVIRVTLAGIIAYLLFHFLWVAWDGFLEWRLRITGTRATFQTGSLLAPDHADFPVDPRQSTLYNWWTHQHGSIGNLGKLADEMQATCGRWESDLEKLKAEHVHSPDWQNMGNIIRTLVESREQAAKLARNVEANTKAMTDARIPTSLRRFDSWFQLFLRSQNLRWLVVEFVAPVAFASFTLYLLLR